MRFVRPEQDRRRYHRAQVPILIRPVSALARFIRYQVQDLGLGGLRCYSDEAHAPGKRLEIEIAFPEGGSAVALVEVVWNEALPAGAPARNDVGLRFVDAGPDDRDRIASLMAAYESP
ncbi:MAG TPA: PilZ domain-containing protein [Anaeromyxobacteraceae bacterium]|nr:PilZ domain-containing protein [Anaeromyxobacteraceae bacterium]